MSRKIAWEKWDEIEFLQDEHLEPEKSEEPTFSSFEEEEAKQLAYQHKMTKRRQMKKEGQHMITVGKDIFTTGKDMITIGQDMITEGSKLIKDSNLGW